MLSHHIDLPQTFKAATQPFTQTFRHSIDIYLKDSNAYTNTYFSRYFEWQGICRERWLHECVSDDDRRQLGVFITRRAHTEYLHETFPFQRVDCELNSFDIRPCSFYIQFRFAVQGQHVATGYQQIAYAGADRRIQRLPDSVLSHVRAYALDDSDAPVMG